MKRIESKKGKNSIKLSWPLKRIYPRKKKLKLVISKLYNQIYLKKTCRYYMSVDGFTYMLNVDIAEWRSNKTKQGKEKYGFIIVLNTPFGDNIYIDPSQLASVFSP